MLIAIIVMPIVMAMTQILRSSSCDPLACDPIKCSAQHLGIVSELSAAPVRAEKKQIAFPHFSSTGEIPRALFYFLIGSSGIVIHAWHAHVKA
jgi:hypothetical protein